MLPASSRGQRPAALELASGLEQLQQLPLMGDALGLLGQLARRRSRQPLGTVDEPALASLDRHERPVGDPRLRAP